MTGDLFTYADAQRRADTGMQQATDHAERDQPGWIERAYDALVAYASQHDEFTAEEARQSLHDNGLPQPPDKRAWGGIFKRAAGKGLIVKAGYAPRRCGNMTPTIVWRASVPRETTT